MLLLFIYRQGSSNQTDASSSKEGTGTSVSETSKEGGFSEDVESAEDSEKTQTTSDAESGGDPTKDSTGNSPLPNDKILGFFKLKACADDNLNAAEIK